MKNIILSLLFLLMMIPVFGQTSPLIRAGNDYYKKGDYQKAIVSYEGVLHNGYESAELYFNLGNAYYKAGKIAPAVLNYERAKRLNPTDDEIKFNLELARNHTVDKIILVPDFFLKRWVNDLSETLSSNSWAYFCIISFFFFLVTFILYLFAWKAGIKKSSFWISLLLFVISVASFDFSYQQKKLITDQNTAIVFTPSVTVKSSPDAKGTDLFVLHEGTKVKITDQVGNWREILIGNGSKGWLLSSDMEVI